ncbi:DmsC/YnfH family molybdoenzyme membrane anchor subunit [Lysobacter yananisis]|uniref:DmsC/YnfH family molybdoenzyme membrane anchor subunit n=1 Tax=Lysobacter yananisis TaxID=1003114 RepID=A0ABY9PFL8_9GAMM|nr:DmsC/YnfH family molybdoenzyme membrane anchor subunit [Lysobacter yananisis]WMT05233.1 DmsC/YnfH family molybdoenzyme membrane anchor subunit [Lysobacter yananisis]
MHPAFSVIFFTTLSGAGYGLMAWLGALALLQHAGLRGAPQLPSFALGAGLLASLVLVTIGLLSSTAHLGKPLRAWRAFSQWRTSWLSREGVMALLTYAPALALLGWLLALDPQRALPPAWPALAGAALAVCALLTVACTAMIYASLPPIPAWRHPLVVPVYLAFALLSGAALLAALPASFAAGRVAAWAVLALAPLTALLKWRYWRAIDRDRLPVTRGEAIGLPARAPSVFERPHTQDNYLTREMGYVLARKHAAKLRAIALALFAALPLALAALALALPAATAPLMAVAALSVLTGALVERWLFFAQARHLVTLYY